jgi:flavin-dependent dehydrogenase
MGLFDLAVVGGGPAGCAAAIGAASSGLTVAIIERTVFPRDIPGEALHPDVESLFSELGVAESVSNAGFIRYPGWILERSGRRDFMPFAGPSGLRFGYQAWRAELDSILLARARYLGATVVQPATRLEVLFVNRRVAGLQVDSDPLHCRYLVDATGSARWLSRKLRLRVDAFSPRLLARFAYFREADALGIIPEFREHTCGWTWLARVRKDCCQCVQLSLAAGTHLPPPALDGCAADLRFRGADVTWRLVSESAGPGYFICGDAAATLDPAASSGVSRALAAGLKAARLATGVIHGTIDEASAGHEYREWLAQEFTDRAAELASRYRALESPPDWLATEFKNSFAEPHTSG